MTFREYAKQKCDITDEQMDEGFHCPCFVGLLDMCNDGNGDCEKCWNREIPETPAPMTAEEAWELAKKLFADFSDTELNEIYGKGWSYPKLMELSPQEAKAKIEEWESKQIQVGDVCKFGDSSEVVVTKVGKVRSEGFYFKHPSEVQIGAVGGFSTDKLHKTGKHIDIQSLLDQIGGGKHD